MENAREVVAMIRSDYPEPLWIQAANLIHDQINSGALKPGARLPPERELCQQLGISRVTLRKALNQLVEAGEWPSTLESFSETAARMGLAPQSLVLRAQVAPASFDEAEELGIAPGTDLFHLDRVRMLDGMPIALDSTKVPLAVLPGIAAADFTTDSLYAALSGAGIEPLRADATMEAREADAEEAGHLRIAVGKPLLVMHQLAVDTAERPLFTSTIRYAGERYRLRTSFSRPQAFGRPRVT
jgi:GntR family transcriptional regulator